jgi:hypothetical protein
MFRAQLRIAIATCAAAAGLCVCAVAAPASVRTEGSSPCHGSGLRAGTATVLQELDAALRPSSERTDGSRVVPADADAAAMTGAGVAGWWGRHSKTVIGVTECILDGAALARLFVVGVSGVGGVVAAAALGLAALTCL